MKREREKGLFQAVCQWSGHVWTALFFPSFCLLVNGAGERLSTSVTTTQPLSIEWGRIRWCTRHEQWLVRWRVISHSVISTPLAVINGSTAAAAASEWMALTFFISTVQSTLAPFAFEHESSQWAALTCDDDNDHQSVKRRCVSIDRWHCLTLFAVSACQSTAIQPVQARQWKNQFSLRHDFTLLYFTHSLTELLCYIVESDYWCCCCCCHTHHLQFKPGTI